jgi:uncharacterized protein (UPF0128 family)
MIYQVSYVVIGGKHAGTIMNQEERPEVGERVEFTGETFEIIEVLEIIPPKGNFTYLHATCKPVE